VAAALVRVPLARLVEVEPMWGVAAMWGCVSDVVWPWAVGVWAWRRAAAGSVNRLVAAWQLAAEAWQSRVVTASAAV
jgi:hypothetical protein